MLCFSYSHVKWCVKSNALASQTQLKMFNHLKQKMLIDGFCCLLLKTKKLLFTTPIFQLCWMQYSYTRLLCYSRDFVRIVRYLWVGKHDDIATALTAALRWITGTASRDLLACRLARHFAGMIQRRKSCSDLAWTVIILRDYEQFLQKCHSWFNSGLWK